MTSLLIPESGIMPDTQAKIDAFKGLGAGLSKGVDTIMLNKALSEMKDIGEGEDPHDKELRVRAMYGPHLSDISRELMESQTYSKRMERQEATRDIHNKRLEEFKKDFGKEVKGSFPDISLSEDQINDFFDAKVMERLVGKNPSPEKRKKALRSPEMRTMVNFIGNLDSLLGEKDVELFKNQKLLDQEVSRLTKDAKDLFSDDPVHLENIYRQLQNVSKLKGQASIAIDLYGSDKNPPPPKTLDEEDVLPWLEENKESLRPVLAKGILLGRLKGSGARKSAGESVRIQNMLKKFYPESAEMRTAEGVKFSGYSHPFSGGITKSLSQKTGRTLAGDLSKFFGIGGSKK